MQTTVFSLAAIGNLDADAVAYQVIGMLVVFCCLGFLCLILSVSGSFAVRMEKKRQAAQSALATDLQQAASAAAPAPAAPAPPTPAAVAALAAGIYDTAAAAVTPELLAVLAAAVKVTVGSEARILSVQPVESNYAFNGRCAIMNSHTPKCPR